jgi:pantoate--beta-alanine ligase
MDVNVLVQDTIREADGLAMSSRNAYLTADERKVAPVVYRSLCSARDLFLNAPGESISANQLREKVEQVLQSEPLVSDVLYVSVDSKATMQSCEQVQKREGALISLACRLGSVRLIDNIVL